MNFTREEIEAAQRTVYCGHAADAAVRLAAARRARLGCRLWAKHENHTPLGAFKVRGGLTYMEALVREQPGVRHVVSATRGNHGQSIGFAAARHGLAATIVVPHGNSVEKNAAMRCAGRAARRARRRFPGSQRTCGGAGRRDRAAPRAFVRARPGARRRDRRDVEFFEALQRAGEVPDVLFVPIGLGSGFAAAAAARRHCGVRTKLVGVVSSHATAYRDSFRAGRPIEAPVTTLLADGMACRTPGARIGRGAAARGRRRGCGERRRSGRRRCASSSATRTTWPRAPAPRHWRPRCSSATAGAAGRSASPLTGGNVDAAVFARVLTSAP